MNEFQFIIDDYLRWIKENSKVRTIKSGETGVLTTPFMDQHNDHIEIYVQKQGDRFLLTDDGYTVADLEGSGLTFNSPKRQKIRDVVLAGFGIRLGENDDLFVEANINNLPQKKHYLLQAILAVSDMYNLATENVASLFKEDVETYLASNNLIFSKDIRITGKSGFDHSIDFIIPRSPQGDKPERLIKTINTPKKDNVMATIFSFTDIAETRDEGTQNYVFYNDITSTAPISRDSINALETYGIRDVPWSQRENYKEELQLNSIS